MNALKFDIKTPSTIIFSDQTIRIKLSGEINVPDDNICLLYSIFDGIIIPTGVKVLHNGTMDNISLDIKNISDKTIILEQNVPIIGFVYIPCPIKKIKNKVKSHE